MRRSMIVAMTAVSGAGLVVSYHLSEASTTAAIAVSSVAPVGANPIATTRATTTATAHRPRARAALAGTARLSAGATTTSTARVASRAPTTVAVPTRTTPVTTTPAVSKAPSGTFTGNPVPTQWGIVQVQITVAAGKITSVQTLQHPNDNGHSVDINTYALPLLQAEAVQANSAQINAISGATVTSGGYVQSLQSAIDQAHL
jgi:uncharacterized protein with FMN-binding domain